MASHHEIVDFIENIRAEMPARLHGLYEEAVDRALEQQNKRGKEFAKQIIKNSPMIRREFDHQKEEEGVLAIFVLIVGFLGGAALMYLFDPDRGEQRRASLLGQVNHAAEQARDEVNSTLQQATDSVKDAVGQADKAVDTASNNLKEASTQVRDSASKAVSSASGTVKETAGQVKGTVENAAVSDATLSARVRVEIAKDVRSPGAIEVTINQGVVTLKGQVQASEVKGLIEKLEATPGVKSVENRLEIHDATTPASGNGAH